MDCKFAKKWRLKLVPIVVLGLGLSACVSGPIEATKVTGTDSFIVVGARVFDGENVLPKTNVLVQDGLIVAVGPEVNVRNITRISGRGRTLLPGLIDGHAHTESVGQLNEALRFGITTVLDMGTFPEYDKTLRDAARSRADLADFRSSGIFITPTRGHGTEYGYDIATLNRAEDAEKFVDDRINAGADYLKLVINGVRNKRSGMPTQSADTVHAITKVGHERGMLVVAHIESEDDVRLAVAAGVDGLVHHWRDSGARPDLAQLIASKGIFVIGGDAVVIDGFLNQGPQQLLADKLISPYLSDQSRRDLTRPLNPPPSLTIQPVVAGLRSLVEADVLLLAGTDAATINPRIVHGASIHRLLELMVVAGMLPTQALQSATANIVDAFGLTDRGRIKSGLRADMVLIRGDPTQNILATRDIVKVWRGGVEVERQLSELD